MTDAGQYAELQAYSLSHGDPYFIHQNVVDAYAAQHAPADSKPIVLTFALAGLYLTIEKQFTGRQVQLAHMRMARHRKPWPAWTLPEHRGTIGVDAVMSAPPGEQRDAMILAWCADVWSAWHEAHAAVRELVDRELAG